MKKLKLDEVTRMSKRLNLTNEKQEKRNVLKLKVEGSLEIKLTAFNSHLMRII